MRHIEVTLIEGQTGRPGLFAEPHVAVDGQPQRIDKPGTGKELQRTGTALDEEALDAALFEFGDQQRSRERLLDDDDLGHPLKPGQRPCGKDELAAGALREEVHRGVEPARCGEGHLVDILRASFGAAPGAQLPVAHEQRGVVAAQRLGADQNGVACGTEALYLREVFGRGDDETLRRGVVHIAVGRDGGRCIDIHRMRVKRVISG